MINRIISAISVAAAVVVPIVLFVQFLPQIDNAASILVTAAERPRWTIPDLVLNEKKTVPVVELPSCGSSEVLDALTSVIKKDFEAELSKPNLDSFTLMKLQEGFNAKITYSGVNEGPTVGNTKQCTANMTYEMEVGPPAMLVAYTVQLTEDGRVKVTETSADWLDSTPQKAESDEARELRLLREQQSDQFRRQENEQRRQEWYQDLENMKRRQQEQIEQQQRDEDQFNERRRSLDRLNQDY